MVFFRFPLYDEAVVVDSLVVTEGCMVCHFRKMHLQIALVLLIPSKSKTFLI